MSTERSEPEIRAIMTRLLQVVQTYVAQLNEVDPTTRKGARMVDAVAKLLARIKDFEQYLSEEEQDLVAQLAKLRKTTVKITTDRDDRIRAALEYLRLAILELGGE